MPVQSSLPSNWLRSYYLTRAMFSISWIISALLSGGHVELVSTLLVIYPAWDAVANFVDARVNGGLKPNPSQTLNVFVSSITTFAVILAIMRDTYAVLVVFGIWAIFSGVLQLYTGVSRWRIYGAQWVMILSGAQSAMAGGFMISQSFSTTPPSILDIVPYAGFGAFYFLLSAIWLAVAAYRRTRVAG